MQYTGQIAECGSSTMVGWSLFSTLQNLILILRPCWKLKCFNNMFQKPCWKFECMLKTVLKNFNVCWKFQWMLKTMLKNSVEKFNTCWKPCSKSCWKFQCMLKMCWNSWHLLKICQNHHDVTITLMHNSSNEIKNWYY